MKPRRISFVYAFGPSGHSQAAQALREQMGLLDPSVQTDSVDLTELHPFLGSLISRAYLEVIQKTPKLWDYLYDNAAVADALGDLREMLSRGHRRKLGARLAKFKPDVVVCTHALPCATLSVEKDLGALSARLVAVLTDFGVHAYWLSERVDLYIAPNEEARDELVRRGISPSKIRVTGIPVSARFSRPPGRSEARRGLGLDPAFPMVLVAGGAHGLGPMQDIVARLYHDFPDLQIAAACGNNETLQERLREKFSSSRRVAVLGFSDNMGICLAAADVLIGKAGGLTSSEAMALGAPMVILSPLPGQEERNSAYLVSRGAAARVEDQDELSETVGALLKSPEKLAAMRQAALTLGRPASAESACREILALLPHDPGQKPGGHGRPEIAARKP